VPGGVEKQIAALAHRQHGNVTRAQLLRLGLNPTAISKRVRRGRLYRGHNGVYAVGRPPKTPLERAAAAVLACGPRAALCCQSAFSLWGFDKHWQFPLNVCAPTNRTRPGIVTHRFPSLAKKDVRTQLGIRVTSPARTLLDHAPNLTRQQLRRAMANAGRSDTAVIALAPLRARAAARRCRSRRGAGQLGAAPSREPDIGHSLYGSSSHLAQDP
jgi:predicted transcriptional regulator of viral defense system